MYEFTEMQQDSEPLFLFLEIPSNKENQKNIERNDNVVLSVNLISPNNLGICNIYKDRSGKNIYKIVEKLKKYKIFYKYSMINAKQEKNNNEKRNTKT